jgi:P pilus assembly chaperone PapD
MKTILTVLVLLWSTVAASAQVVLAPTAVYMSDNQRSATFLVVNNTTEEKDVALRLQFGYPVSDSNGNVTMMYTDTAVAQRFSCTDWIQVFPRKFRLAPGARQIVRLTARTPQTAAEGMYWSRLITTSSAAAEEDTTDQVGARINFSVHQVVPVTYKKGSPSIDLTATGLRLVQSDNNRTVPALDLAVQGNGPFIGTITVTLERDGADAITRSIPVSVYFSTVKRLSDVLPELTTGSWKMSVVVKSGKEDLDPALIIDTAERTATALLDVSATGSLALR